MKLFKKAYLLFALAFILPIVSIAQQNSDQSVAESVFGEHKTPLFLVLSIMLFVWLVVISFLGNAIKNLSSQKTIWKDFFSGKYQSIILVLVGVFSTNTSFAASTGTSSFDDFLNVSDELIWILITLNVLLAFSAWWLTVVLNKLIKTLKNEKVAETQDILEVWTEKLTLAKPIEKEEEILMNHEYDGIRELDNVLPPWWLYMFYATIVFAVLYIPYYHFGFGGKSQAQEYIDEVQEANIQVENYLKKLSNLVDENNATMLLDVASLEKGKKIYIEFCAACHGQLGEGGIGPNMTDVYWLHGGDIKNVFKTVKYGVPAKGMQPWKDQLTPSQIHEVSSYILSLQGTNPPNAKAPQGEMFVKTDSTNTFSTDTLLTQNPDSISIVNP